MPAFDPAQLQQMVDDERAAMASAARRRRTSLSQQQRTTASWAGIVRAAVVGGEGVALVLAGGGHRAGTVVAGSSDHLVLRDPTGAHRIIPTASINTMRAERGDARARPAEATARPTTDPSALADLLELLVAHRRNVTVALRHGAGAIEGIVAAAGADVISVRQPDGGVAHVPLGAVAELVVR